jgi:hypothetical protein
LCYKYYRALRGFLCCVFCQELRLGALSNLPKAIGSFLVVRPNAVGSGCQVRVKTLPKKANSVGPSSPAGSNSIGFGWPRLNALQAEAGSGCRSRTTDFGSGYAAIPKDIIICMINILNFIIINIIICFINIINKNLINLKKNYYQYWKTTIDLIWSVKLKIIIIIIIIINFKKLILLSKKNHNYF